MRSALSRSCSAPELRLDLGLRLEQLAVAGLVLQALLERSRHTQMQQQRRQQQRPAVKLQRSRHGREEGRRGEGKTKHRRAGGARATWRLASCVLPLAAQDSFLLSGAERRGVEGSGVEWSGNPAVDSSSSSSSSFCISDTTRTLLSCLSASSPLEMLCMRLRVVEPGAAYLRPQGGEASQHHALELESLDPSVRVWPGQDHQHRWSLREASSAARPSTDNVRARVHLESTSSSSPLLSNLFAITHFIAMVGRAEIQPAMQRLFSVRG